MLVKVDSIMFNGLDTEGVTVEVNISNRGIPSFDIVGLAAKSVEESRHRVKTAFQNSGFDFPDKKITVNLAPADINKEGSFYDLPIAVGILSVAYGLKLPESSLFFGEISLNGELRHTKGSFLLALYAKQVGFKNIFVPQDCCMEAGSVTGADVIGVPNLKLLLDHLSTKRGITPFQLLEKETFLSKTDEQAVEDTSMLRSILGQEQLKRALQICAAGGHNMIMVGPPGSGKTMAAKALAELLPPLAESEAVEVTKIASLIGKIPPNFGLITKRPFRNPHHTASYAGLIGGGKYPNAW